MLGDFEGFGEIKEPNVFEELNFRFFSVSHPETGLVRFEPVVVEILGDFILLFLIDEAIGTHVDEFFEVILGQDVGETPFDVDLVLVDVRAFVQEDEGRLVFLRTGADSDEGLEDEEGDLGLESVVDFGGVVFEEGVN